MNRLFAPIALAGLAVALFSGTAEAKRPRPPKPPRPPRHVMAIVHSSPAPREVESDLCATVERAEADAHRHLERAVRDWLADSGVDRSWTPPQNLVDGLVMERPAFEPVRVKDLDVVKATLTADFSDGRKAEFLKVYRRQVGGQRLAIFGGILAVVLTVLAALTGYIRADEATKGYYTNRLRLLAAAGVGAAGVVVYRVLT